MLQIQRMYYTESFYHLNEKKTCREEVEEMEWNEMNCTNRRRKKNRSKRKQKAIYKGAAVASLDVHLFTIRNDTYGMNG